MTQEDNVRDDRYWTVVAILSVVFVAILAIAPTIIQPAISGFFIAGYTVLVFGPLAIAAAMLVAGLGKGLYWLGKRVVSCSQGNCCFTLNCT